MERFLNIDWNPSLNDVIDDVFINEERLEEESVMHRIMTGNFTDPFKDIEEDCRNIDASLLKNEEEELVAEERNAKIIEEQSMKNMPKKAELTKKAYVPGIVKSAFKYPKQSSLSKEQHALCLRVMLRLSELDKRQLNQTEKAEVQTYMKLKQLISREQEEFLEFAKSKWDIRKLQLVCEDYINLRWKSKSQAIKKLPRFYSEVTNVPFVATKEVGIKFLSTCLQIGNLSKITLPPLTRPCMLRINSQELEERLPPRSYVHGSAAACFRLPVSEDPNCQRLAEENNVDLVISSSGLNCLVNNIGENRTNSWILPVVIKRQNDKTVIYIDKAAPPVASTIPEKNTWVYKYILNRFFIQPQKPTPRRLAKAGSEMPKYESLFGNVNSEEFLKLEDAHEQNVTNTNIRLPLSDSTKDHTSEKLETQNILERNTDSGNTEKTDVQFCSSSAKNIHGIITNDITERTRNELTECHENIEHKYTPDCQYGESLNEIKEDSDAFSGENVSYRLFVIGSQSLKQNELMKNSVIKDYKILVRTKTDGYEELPDDTRRPLMLAPKLEYQVDLGAEAVTLEESLRQWIALIFRPDASLAQARIFAETSEILQIERRTALSISSEIKRLYNVKAEDSLTVFHNVIQTLQTLSSGRYIMRYTVRNRAFATVYKEADGPRKNIFDLYSIFPTEYQTIPNSPWLRIDNCIVTPTHKCFERMPAMFYPSNRATSFMTQKAINETKQSNTGIIRRSLRNKNK